MFYCLELKCQVNQSSGRHLNTGQQRLYEFCYLLPFDFWTSFLAKILFLKGCGSLFENLLLLQRSLMGCNIVPCVARIHKCFIYLFKCVSGLSVFAVSGDFSF